MRYRLLAVLICWATALALGTNGALADQGGSPNANACLGQFVAKGTEAFGDANVHDHFLHFGVFVGVANVGELVKHIDSVACTRP